MVWDVLALAGSALQVSKAFALGGANAIEFVAVVIGAGGAIQTLLQVQGTSDGHNWTDLGSSVQLLTVGSTASPVISGMTFRWFRIAAQNQTANTVVFSVAARLSCG
jgi:NADH:ubiquinone oxidoreductase subunit 6 (subunit J)